MLALAFAGQPPDPADLATRWRSLLDAAREVVEVLPAEEAGTAVLTAGGDLFAGDATQAVEAHRRRALLFHQGRIGGALPRVIR